MPPGGWQHLTWLHSNLRPAVCSTCPPGGMETHPHSNLNTHIHNSQRVRTVRVSPAEDRSQHTCPSTPRTIPQPPRGEALTLATTWMDPEDTMLSEENRHRRTHRGVILLMKRPEQDAPHRHTEWALVVRGWGAADTAQHHPHTPEAIATVSRPWMPRLKVIYGPHHQPQPTPLHAQTQSSYPLTF